MSCLSTRVLPSTAPRLALLRPAAAPLAHVRSNASETAGKAAAQESKEQPPPGDAADKHNAKPLDVKVVHVGAGRSSMATVAAAATAVGVGGLGVYAWKREQEKQEKQRQEQEHELKLKEEKAKRERELKQQQETRRKADQEAAAMQAALREKQAREEREAKARVECQPGLHAVELRLSEAAAPGVSDEAADLLRRAISDASAIVGRVALSDDDGAAARTLLERATARLAEVDRAALARSTREAAQKSLESAMTSQDSAACRAALADISSAEEVLTSLGELVPSDGGLAADATSHLEEFERREVATARRQAARLALDSAVAARDPGACADALAEAREAGVEPCPALQLAAILTEPLPAYRQLAGSVAAQLAPPGRLEERGISVEDLVQAETDASTVLGVEKLRTRAAELAAAIVTTHCHMAQKLDGALPEAEQQLLDACARRANEALKHFDEEWDRVDQARAAELSSIYRERMEEARVEVVNKIRDDAEVSRQRLHEDANRRLESELANDQTALSNRLASLEMPAVSLEGLDQNAASHKHRASATVGASAAAVASTSGLVPKDLAVEDTFASRVLSALQSDTAAKEKVPAVAQLRHQFESELNGMAAAAFTAPYGGVLSWMMSAAVGRAFASLYVFRGGGSSDGLPPPSADASDEEEALRRNLGALSRAARHLEGGELIKAFSELDSELTGLCRGRAAAWMEEARHTLLVEQAARALQARARCLNATLS